MNTRNALALITVTLLAACSQAPDTAKQAGMADHAQMAAQASAPAGDTAKSVKTGSAIGTIQSIDAAAGKITIAHGPIEALGWPGMTMAFKASPEQIASVKTGQKVKFDVQLQGSEATITKIAAAQ